MEGASRWGVVPQRWCSSERGYGVVCAWHCPGLEGMGKRMMMMGKKTEPEVAHSWEKRRGEAGKVMKEGKGVGRVGRPGAVVAGCYSYVRGHGFGVVWVGPGPARTA